MRRSGAVSTRVTGERRLAFVLVAPAALLMLAVMR